MIKKLLIGTFSYTLLLGVLAVALYKTIGVNITYLNFSSYGIGMYTYDFASYTMGLRNAMESLKEVNILEEPTIPTFNWSDVIPALKSIGNIFVVGINWIIFAFNALLAVIKLIFYIIVIVLSIFGLNTEEIYLYDLSLKFYEIQIPYIDPIT